MTTVILKELIGVDKFASPENLDIKNKPITFFNLFDLGMEAAYLNSVNPVPALFKSGWIVDGTFIVTDQGKMSGIGFDWLGVQNKIGRDLIRKNKKLNIEPGPGILSLTGSKNIDAYFCNRHIDNDEITDAIFLSGFDNLSHFMMEIAPKSLLFSKILAINPHIQTVFTSKLVPKKWIEYSIKTAESLAGKDFNLTVKQFDPDKAVRFKNIIAISSTSYRGEDLKLRMSTNQARKFSQQMCKNASSFTDEEPYILYLSRKHASHRRTINQDNLVKITKKVFPKFKFVLEDQIHKLCMEDQAKLVYNANLIIEEAGGSTAFTNNLLNKETPYVCIISTQRDNQGGKLYLTGLGKYAAWVLGEPIGEIVKTTNIDNDIQVDENDFEEMLIRLSLFIEKKIPMPTI